ncbi:hypothetical protein SAMN02194393_04664 [Maledivibacter halophilus]|uniref:Uncharacterized protein n=1 Tax=Maledivibacter halophilus TaxID=36842 RepID=A0A1T5MH35_9FIRM|nr:hypothetical protein SAMN02194393_04664 [Maledivibacter halophilus]
MLRKKLLMRKILGVILGLTGAIIVIEFVPLKFWYTVLVGLIISFFIILFLYLQ